MSLDGGGIRGLITANVVNYMEHYAYEYALDNECIEESPKNPRISLSKLFDMVSGTSTGSLLTTTIVLPVSEEDKTNKYYAEDAMEIYEKRGSEVF